ncbi:mtcA2 [Symbiodinium necroappetens]|uniref:carbonic anhydrase n=1 Tax=Symbiodinium necroappetens TaxID=1628268 RepID=A0A812QWF4_9DINO|nr:mtcA2 [Symbiodinium necroappetens]
MAAGVRALDGLFVTAVDGTEKARTQSQNSAWHDVLDLCKRGFLAKLEIMTGELKQEVKNELRSAVAALRTEVAEVIRTHEAPLSQQMKVLSDQLSRLAALAAVPPPQPDFSPVIDQIDVSAREQREMSSVLGHRLSQVDLKINASGSELATMVRQLDDKVARLAEKQDVSVEKMIGLCDASDALLGAAGRIARELDSLHVQEVRYQEKLGTLLEDSVLEHLAEVRESVLNIDLSEVQADIYRGRKQADADFRTVLAEISRIQQALQLDFVQVLADKVNDRSRSSVIMPMEAASPSPEAPALSSLQSLAKQAKVTRRLREFQTQTEAPPCVAVWTQTDPVVFEDKESKKKKKPPVPKRMRTQLPAVMKGADRLAQPPVARDGRSQGAYDQVRFRATTTSNGQRLELVDDGQAPHTAIVGCADSRAPVEVIFDALPGDIFVLRNAGNTCTHAEGSMIGSLEFCTGNLGARLVMVLGHTKCGAIYGATKAHFARKKQAAQSQSALEGLLEGLGEVAEQAEYDMGPMADEDFVAAHAVKVNVFHTMNFLLQYSKGLREAVKSGKIDIQGGVYDLSTGVVEFLGRSPRQAELLSAASAAIPPSMLGISRAGAAKRGIHGVRTGDDASVSPEKAMEMLKDGNNRFVAGTPASVAANAKMKTALVKSGQAPHTAIIGCADSRAPIETVFDAMPGEIFVLRNAGNTCTHAEGAMLGSLEFCTGKLGSRLVMVLGHTKCGAIVGATQTYLAMKDAKGEKGSPGSALEGLLVDLAGVAEKAATELGKGATVEQIAAHAVKVNVFQTMEFLLKFSQPLRDAVTSGKVDLQGGIYDLETGKVEFLGRSPEQAALLTSKSSLPPSMDLALGRASVRTPQDPPMAPEAALKIMKEGNERFVHGNTLAGKFDGQMRKALATIGQAPHTAIVGCADSRVPLELVFDVLPGDVFVMRNAGNAVTQARGSIVGSLEFCTAALKTRLVLVLGHTACGAIKGATATYLKGGGAAQGKGALEGLLAALAGVAETAHKELGNKASEKEIADHAVKVNVFNTINNLIQGSADIRDKVKSGQVEIQGGVYDLDSGRVQWLGRSPEQAKLLS